MQLDTKNPNYQVDADNGYQFCRQMRLDGSEFWRAYTKSNQSAFEGSKAECIEACNKHMSEVAA